MVGQVEDRGLIRRGLVVNRPDVVRTHQIRDLARHRAREAHLSVLGDVGELKALYRTTVERTSLPHLLVPALGATMQIAVTGGLILVDRQLVLLVVDLELAVGDAIAEAPNQRAHRETQRLVFARRIPAQRDVREVAELVRRVATHQAPTIIGDVEDETSNALQTVDLHRRAILEFPERNHLAAHHRSTQGTVTRHAAHILTDGDRGLGHGLGRFGCLCGFRRILRHAHAGREGRAH